MNGATPRHTVNWAPSEPLIGRRTPTEPRIVHLVTDANLASMGVHSIRSFYREGFAPTYETVSLLRQRGMTWGVIAVEEDELQVPDARMRVAAIPTAGRRASTPRPPSSRRSTGPAYRPPSIGLRMSAPVADVRWTALGKRDGSVRVHLRRAAEVYDPRTERTLSVPRETVTIPTARGTRTVAVGAEVVSVLL